MTPSSGAKAINAGATSSRKRAASVLARQPATFSKAFIVESLTEIAHFSVSFSWPPRFRSVFFLGATEHLLYHFEYGDANPKHAFGARFSR